MTNIPGDLLYTKDHEWIRIEGDLGTVGITDYAQHALGDIVFIELPRKGDRLVSGRPMGNVESVKAVSEIYAPVSGEIAEVNSTLDSAPDALNREPYGAGWICRIRLASPSEASTLLGPEAYAKLVEEGGAQ